MASRTGLFFYFFLPSFLSFFLSLSLPPPHLRFLPSGNTEDGKESLQVVTSFFLLLALAEDATAPIPSQRVTQSADAMRWTFRSSRFDGIRAIRQQIEHIMAETKEEIGGSNQMISLLAGPSYSTSNS